MKRLLFLLIFMSLVFSFCSTKMNRVETEIDFANKMAMRGLWKEAYFRWQKSLEQGGESALLHNNMAVALEKMGKYEDAVKEYENALKLSPGNSYIKTNLKSVKRLIEGKDEKEDEATGGKDKGKGKGKSKGKKKEVKMKNKYRFLTILAALPVFMFLACSTAGEHMSVRIPVKNKKAVDFKTAKTVLYDEFKIENPPENYEPKQQVEDLFLVDLPKYIKKDIAVLKEDTDKTSSFIISGTMKFDIKDRRVIRKTKSESGKKEKQFVSVQHWELSLEIIITENDTGKELFKKNYQAKLKDVTPDETDYNFKALFNKVSDNFVRDILKKERFEQRYLLLR